MLDEAKKLYKWWSIEDIQNFLPDFVSQYVDIDSMQAENETNHDLKRLELYVDLKKQKKDKKNSYSDKDIDVISKYEALKQYWDTNKQRRTSYHYKMYIDLLNQRIINLQVADKRLREWVWY